MSFDLPSNTMTPTALPDASGVNIGAAASDPAKEMIKKLVMQQMMGGGQQAPIYQQAPIRGGMRGQGSGLGGLLGKALTTAAGAYALNKMKPKVPGVPGVSAAPAAGMPENENLGADGVYRSQGE